MRFIRSHTGIESSDTCALTGEGELVADGVCVPVPEGVPVVEAVLLGEAVPVSATVLRNVNFIRVCPKLAQINTHRSVTVYCSLMLCPKACQTHSLHVATTSKYHRFAISFRFGLSYDMPVCVGSGVRLFVGVCEEVEVEDAVWEPVPELVGVLDAALTCKSDDRPRPRLITFHATWSILTSITWRICRACCAT